MIHEVMETKEGITVSSGVTVKAEEAPDGFRVAPKNKKLTSNLNPKQ